MYSGIRTANVPLSYMLQSRLIVLLENVLICLTMQWCVSLTVRHHRLSAHGKDWPTIVSLSKLVHRNPSVFVFSVLLWIHQDQSSSSFPLEHIGCCTADGYVSLHCGLDLEYLLGNDILHLSEWVSLGDDILYLSEWGWYSVHPS